MPASYATSFKRYPGSFWTALVVALLCFSHAFAADPSFPALTGRIVDQAGVFSPTQRDAIETKLKAHEDKTSDQIVVATVRSLEGYAVEDYANRLFRFWKLGQAKTNNGVLLLIAPNERKLRIEVGYGLEGALTDAISSVIISTVIAPKLKAGDFGAGAEAGVDAIISAVSGDDEWKQRAQLRRTDQMSPAIPIILIVIAFIVIFIIIPILLERRGQAGGTRYHRTRRGRWVAAPTPSSTWGGGWSGGGSSWSGGGGFSGGGGSSGGGGASGSW